MNPEETKAAERFIESDDLTPATPVFPAGEAMVKVLLLPSTAHRVNERFAESVKIPCKDDAQVQRIMRECFDAIEAIRLSYAKP